MSQKDLSPKTIEQIQAMLKNKTPYKQISAKVNVTVHQVFKVNKGIQVYNRGKHLGAWGVSAKLHEEINNIADNIGIPIGEFLINKYRDIAASYPDKMKLPKPKI